jgi:hypothetical protein
MKTFQYFVWGVFKGTVAVSTVSLALAGCATVDLEPDGNAPQVRMPGSEPQMRMPSSEPQMQIPGSEPQMQMPSSEPQMQIPGSEPITPAPEIPAPQSASSADVSSASAQLITLVTHPDGPSVVPPTPSSATAQIDLVYDTSTRLLRWKAQWSDLSSPITAVTFYGPATQGQQGPPTLIWPGPFGPRYEGRATLAPQQATDLMGGLWYVSISTENYPGGEIRGQLRAVY